MRGERYSPWVFLLPLLPLVCADIGLNDCVRLALISFAYPQILASPKNSIIAENCLPGNDSTEWDVNADGDPSIQVNLCSSDYFAIGLPSTGLCHKIQRCQGRDCPLQDKDRLLELPTGYLPRWMVWYHQEPLRLVQVRGCWSQASGKCRSSSFTSTSPGIVK